MSDSRLKKRYYYALTAAFALFALTLFLYFSGLDEGPNRKMRQIVNYLMGAKDESSIRAESFVPLKSEIIRAAERKKAKEKEQKEKEPKLIPLRPL